MLISSHLDKHKDDVRRYMEKKGCGGIDAISFHILSFIEDIIRVKGKVETPNKFKGEKERWRIILHFYCCAKIRYVVAEIENNKILVTAHPDDDAEAYVEYLEGS